MGVAVSVETEVHDFAMNRGWTGVSTKGVPAHTYWTFESMGDETDIHVCTRIPNAVTVARLSDRIHYS